VAFISIDNPTSLPTLWKQGVAAVGNMDGLHLGHQALLREARLRADHRNTKALVLTFEPHPREFFTPERPLFRLSSAEQKGALCKRYKMDGLMTVSFNEVLANQSAHNFANYLFDTLSLKGIVIGPDFRFGQNRVGDTKLLREISAKYDAHVHEIDPVTDQGGRISSSRIRDALSNGRIAEATSALGRPWSITGTVIHGAKRGRLLGYPTANLVLPATAALKHGVYVVEGHVMRHAYRGVASFGVRPMFDSGEPLLETHLFDFSDDIYGRELEVSLLHYIRPEMRFSSVEDLMKAMEQDSLIARAWPNI
jgi:riboflavin kinase / FMN adenylyltransferase